MEQTNDCYAIAVEFGKARKRFQKGVGLLTYWTERPCLDMVPFDTDE
jgi:hypothetical protein